MSNKFELFTMPANDGGYSVLTHGLPCRNFCMTNEDGISNHTVGINVYKLYEGAEDRAEERLGRIVLHPAPDWYGRRVFRAQTLWETAPYYFCDSSEAVIWIGRQTGALPDWFKYEYKQTEVREGERRRMATA